MPTIHVIFYRLTLMKKFSIQIKELIFSKSSVQISNISMDRFHHLALLLFRALIHQCLWHKIAKLILQHLSQHKRLCGAHCIDKCLNLLFVCRFQASFNHMRSVFITAQIQNRIGDKHFANQLIAECLECGLLTVPFALLHNALNHIIAISCQRQIEMIAIHK